jgi:anti-anti-sigma factor
VTTVEETADGDIAIFRLAGELDMKDAPSVKQQLVARARGERPRAVVNLAGLRYIDSAGLGVLIGARNVYTAKGGNLLLAAARPEVHHILQITRLLQHFAVHASEADAVGALR